MHSVYAVDIKHISLYSIGMELDLVGLSVPVELPFIIEYEFMKFQLHRRSSWHILSTGFLKHHNLSEAKIWNFGNILYEKFIYVDIVCMDMDIRLCVWNPFRYYDANVTVTVTHSIYTIHTT